MIKSAKPRLLIEKWAISRRKDDCDKTYSFLVGVCPTHPKFLAMSEEDRKKNMIMSSSLVLYFNFEKRIAETCNTVYELGSIDEFWAKALEHEGILLSSFDFDERTAHVG